MFVVAYFLNHEHWKGSIKGTARVIHLLRQQDTNYQYKFSTCYCLDVYKLLFIVTDYFALNAR